MQCVCVHLLREISIENPILKTNKNIDSKKMNF